MRNSHISLNHRIGIFNFAFNDSCRGPYSLYRGFFSSEVLQEGNRLLDIGCGDGFFTKRFLAEKCARVDAVDIEPSAIAAATTYNSAPNITYHLLDAVNQTFPSEHYNVVVWDGALGHFSADTTNYMLQKICQALTPDGIFVGSESLGTEGHDHLQFFYSLNDFYLLFKPYFKHIELRCVTYRIGLDGEFIRQEAYWRCANDLKRLEECSWCNYSLHTAAVQQI